MIAPASSAPSRRTSGKPAPLSLVRASRQAVLLASLAIGVTGWVAGAVRVLPWLLDPSVPWPVAAPFARGLAAVAVEASLLAGWPIGWSLACFRFVESGEARVLQTLGERPAATLRRLAPQGTVLALALGVVAAAYGREASAPGRVATELVERAGASCAAARSPVTYAVPFTDLTWLCGGGSAPRLVGGLPGAMSSIVLTARGARIAGDFRALELDDARALLPGQPPTALHVGALAVRGMPPWAQASSLPPAARAFVLVLAAFFAAFVSALAVLRGNFRTRLEVLAFGATGPLAALGVLRLLERGAASAGIFILLVPAAAAASPAVAAWLVASARLRLPLRLRRTKAAAST